MVLLSAHQASKQFGVSSRTLRRWHSQGRVKAERTYSGIRLYDVTHILSTCVGPQILYRTTFQIHLRASFESEATERPRTTETRSPTTLSFTSRPHRRCKRHQLEETRTKALLERSRRGLVTEVVLCLVAPFDSFECMLITYFRLWLPTETDSVALLSTSSSTSSVSMVPRLSWYTQVMTHKPLHPLPTNLLRTSSQSIQSSSAVCKDNVQQKTDEGQTNSRQDMQKRKIGALLSYTRKKRKVEGLIRSLKVRIYPNMKQKNLMRRWMGCTRLVYNMVVEASQGANCNDNFAYFRSLRRQRIDDGSWSFIAEVQYNILDEAMKEAIQARDLVQVRNQETRAAGGLPCHRLSFRNRKELHQTITIRQQMASIEQALNNAQESVREAEKNLREAQTENEKEFWRGRLEVRERK